MSEIGVVVKKIASCIVYVYSERVEHVKIIRKCVFQ